MSAFGTRGLGPLSQQDTLDSMSLITSGHTPLDVSLSGTEPVREAARVGIGESRPKRVRESDD